MTELTTWTNFYVVVGSAAGALIGLQFVVLTLIMRLVDRLPTEASAAFSTPTIVNFSVSLFLSALLNAPWQSVKPPAVVWSSVGLAGIIYGIAIFRRMRSQSIYKPVIEDWMFHCVLPMLAYALLLVSGIVAWTYAREALFAVAAAVLLFLFIGIHNAWDAVTYHVYKQKGDEDPDGRSSEITDND